MLDDIRIFVSCRIDIDSVQIDNPLYIPVRCGALFDQNKESSLLGDDSGDNISHCRNIYSEYTVQYWAWKNHMSEWVGLCHYRRYLAFKSICKKRNDYNMIHEISLTKRCARKYGLLDLEAMSSLIRSSDAVVSEYAPVVNIRTPNGYVKTVRELWDAHNNIFIDEDTIPAMLRLIDTFSPQYSESARAYLNGNMHRGFNCYILRKNLFDRLCCFQFPIMERISEEYESKNYTGNMARIPAYVGEILYGIFMYHISEVEHIPVKTLPIVFFEETEIQKGVFCIIKRYLHYYVINFFKYVTMPIFPLGSERREMIKKQLRRYKILKR